MVLRITRTWMAIALLVLATGAFGCADSVENLSDPTAGGSGSGTSSGTGQLTVGITDSPFSDALAVLITFSEVSVHRSGGDWESVSFAGTATSRTCDLKKLQGPTDILGVSLLPAGHYTQIRLAVQSATIYFANPSVSATPCDTAIVAPLGAHAEVTVPSGEVKLNREFTLAAGGSVNIVLDFDGDQSIRQQGNSKGLPEDRRYSLQPVIAVESVTTVP